MNYLWYRGAEVESRRKIVATYRVIIVSLFLFLFIIPPLVERITERASVNAIEEEAAHKAFTQITQDFKSLRQEIFSDGSISRQEYVQWVGLVYSLSRKFQLATGIHNYPVSDMLQRLSHKLFLSERARGWESVFGKNMRHAGHAWDQNLEFQQFMIDEVTALQQQVPELSPVSNSQLQAAGMWLVRNYLLFIPFGALLLLGNLYLYGQSFKRQLVFGFWRALFVAPLGFLALPFFGDCNYFEQRRNKIRWRLFSGKSQLTSHEEALILRLASEPLERVDNSIRQGKLAVVFASFLGFLSLPMFGLSKARAEEGKKKHETTAMEDSTGKGQMEIPAAPPKVSGQLRVRYSTATGQVSLRTALLNISGFHLGRYELETDISTGRISKALFSHHITHWLNITVGRFKSEWLAFAPPPHTDNVLGGVRAGEEMVGRETGVKVSSHMGDFNAAAEYSSGSQQRLNLRVGYTGVITTNFLADVSLNSVCERKLAGNVVVQVSQVTFGSMVVWKRQGTIKRVVGIAECGYNPAPEWYVFLLTDFEVGGRRAFLTGATFAPHSDIVLKGNFIPSEQQALFEASYRF